MERVDFESIVVQDVANFHKLGELKVDPWYQRRSVWSPTQRGYLINTLFVKKPIPTIYIRHYLDIEEEKSIKEVVDGQQRIRAVLGYLDDEFSARHPAHPRPVKYSALTPAQKAEFRMTKLPTGILVSANEADVIEIFGRLNSISKTLNAQEKRNAKFSGAMKQFCLETAARNVIFWRESNVFSATNISRMDEVEFISDIVYNMLNGLSDFSAAKIDTLYYGRDDSFDEEPEIQKRIDRVYKILRSVKPETIRDTIFSRSPIFFSLFLVIDEKKRVNEKKLEQTLIDIDAIFNEEKNQSEEDKAFHAACTSSTQRIKNRQERRKYLLTMIA
jgi:hypothetical protein